VPVPASGSAPRGAAAPDARAASGFPGPAEYISLSNPAWKWRIGPDTTNPCELSDARLDVPHPVGPGSPPLQGMSFNSRHSPIIVVALLYSSALLLLFGFGSLALIVPVLFFLIPFRIRIYGLVIFGLYPLGPGFAIAGLRMTLLELMAPIMLLEYLIFQRRSLDRPARNRTLTLAVAAAWIMVLALGISYVRNPAGTARLFGGTGQAYGIRAYWQAACALSAFVVVLGAARDGLYAGRRLVSAVAWVGLVLGLTRVANYLGIIGEVPFFEGNLRYLEFSGGLGDVISTTKRVGGLDQAGGYSFIAAYSAWSISHQKKMLAVAVLAALITVFGGGRSVFAGISLAVLLDITSSGSKSIVRALPILAIAYFLLTGIKVQGQSAASSQFLRISKILTGTQQLEEDEARNLGFASQFAHWRQNPFFGSGISAVARGQGATISAFGGHGAYVSLIGLFGLMGVAFIAFFVMVPLSTGVRFLLRRPPPGPIDAFQMMHFASMLMVLESVFMIGSGNGYADFDVYVAAALLAGACTFIPRGARAGSGLRVVGREPAPAVST
jgi:hypothetical protein